MSDLVLSISETMSSLAIAELTGKRLADVHADIERVFLEVGIDCGNFRSEYRAGNGQSYKCYELPRRECDLIVSGYVAKYRLAIIDRWQELENSAPKLPDFTDASLMARTWADDQDAKLLLSNQVDAMRPQVQALDRIAGSSGSLSVRDSAKALGIKPKYLTDWLIEHKWAARNLDNQLMPHQSAIAKHQMVMVIKTFKRSGRDACYSQALITPLGLRDLGVELSASNQSNKQCQLRLVG